MNDILKKIKNELEKQANKSLEPQTRGCFLISLDIVKRIKNEEYLLAWEKSGY